MTAIRMRFPCRGNKKELKEKRKGGYVLLKILIGDVSMQGKDLLWTAIQQGYMPCHAIEAAAAGRDRKPPSHLCVTGLPPDTVGTTQPACW